MSDTSNENSSNDDKSEATTNAENKNLNVDVTLSANEANSDSTKGESSLKENSQPAAEDPAKKQADDKIADSEKSNATVDTNSIKSETNVNNDSSLPSNTSDNTLSTSISTTPSKIEILLKAVGNAPILKKKKFLLERTKNVHYIIEWLKKYMKLDQKEQLFLYVNQEFAPSPDAEIGTIYDCFKIGNTVIFHYCTTPAWG